MVAKLYEWKVLSGKMVLQGLGASEEEAKKEALKNVFANPLLSNRAKKRIARQLNRRSDHSFSLTY